MNKEFDTKKQESLKHATRNGLAEEGGLSQESGQPGQYVRDTLRIFLLWPLYASGMLKDKKKGSKK